MPTACSKTVQRDLAWGGGSMWTAVGGRRGSPLQAAADDGGGG
jgi:hypothetical protein